MKVVDKNGEIWYGEYVGKPVGDECPPRVWDSGSVTWHCRGVGFPRPGIPVQDATFLHREDGPAAICEDGYMAWYRDGDSSHKEVHPVRSRRP